MTTPRDPREEAPCPGGVGRRWLRVCLTLVRAAAVFVPRAQRENWTREWHAELWHRGSGGGLTKPRDADVRDAAGDPGRGGADSPMAGRRDPQPHPPHSLRIRAPRPSASPARDLAVRALGAFRHALWLRSQEWKPDMLLQDFRYALRALRMAPTFTVMALLTLGIGIGANAVVFNMLDSVLLTPYPFDEPHELVQVHGFDVRDPDNKYSLSYPDYLDLRAAGVFEDIGVWDWEPMNLRGEDETVYIGVGQVTAGLFEVMGVEPIVGRGFTAGEDAPGAGGVVVFAEGFWHRQFGADPDVVGTTVVLDGMPRVVVGVLPQEFTYPDDIVAWVPLAATPESAPRSSRWLGALGRMKPGMTIEQTNAALAPLVESLRREFPGHYDDVGLGVTPLREARVGEVRPFLYVLLGAVGFLLLIVCANVANLLLARATAREREISVRLALGASRTRLVRQLLTESLVLSLGGLAIAAMFSNWAVRAIFAAIPLELPVWIQVRTSLLDIAFMGAVALAATLLFGLVPALQATRTDMRATLAESSGRASGSVVRRLTRHALVVAEVAISVMLLIGAGLMVRSFAELSGVDPGFAAESRLMATMQMPRGKYTTGEMQVGFYRQMMERLGALPGVESVGAVSRMPVRGSSNRQAFRHDGQTAEQMHDNPSVLHNSVSAGYFETMGIPVLAGRGFSGRDTRTAPRVMVVNDELADRYFTDGGAVGRRISFDGESWWQIVGVVGSVRHYGLDVGPDLQAYVPYEQWPQGRLSVILRTAGDPASMAPTLRSEIRAIDPDQALYDLMPVREAVAESVWMQGFFAALMRGFALIAAVIAAVGIYGVTAYAVSRRTQELGVRMALGARSGDIVAMVMRQSMAVVGIGVLIGVGLALLEGMALESMLYEISGSDPATFVGVVALVVAVGLLAAWLPARRATRLDPVRALRDE